MKKKSWGILLIAICMGITLIPFTECIGNEQKEKVMMIITITEGGDYTITAENGELEETNLKKKPLYVGYLLRHLEFSFFMTKENPCYMYIHIPYVCDIYRVKIPCP